jgi:hypothetical protein
MKKISYEQVIEKTIEWHLKRCGDSLHITPELGSLIGGLVDSINENIEDENRQEHPIQPVYIDNQQVIRFKPNKLVQYLLDNGGIDMNQLAMLRYDDSEHEQFAQLIGYSLSGFGELSYVSDKVYEAANKKAEKLKK